MQVLLIAVTFGVLAGISAGLQGPLTSMMSQRIGTLQSIFIIHLGGLLLAGLLLLIAARGDLGPWRSLPWYVLGAGCLGVVLLGAVSYTIPRLGAAATVTLLITGQLLLSVVLDHFGLLGTQVRTVDLGRLVGIVVLFIGTWLIVR